MLKNTDQERKTYRKKTDLTRYTVKEGKHFCWPRVFKFRYKPKKIGWYFIFEENCNYDLQDKDQKDWNKLCGLYFNATNTRDNTVMIGWRYNIDTDEIEMNAYYHINKETAYTPTLLTCKRNQVCEAIIQFDYRKKKYKVELHNRSTQQTVVHEQKSEHRKKLSFEINYYFGGNRTAPQDTTISKGYLDV